MIISGRPWRLVLLGGLVVIAVCGTSVWLLLRAQEKRHGPQVEQRLLAEARMLSEVVRVRWDHLDGERWAQVVGPLRDNGVQIVVGTWEGHVLTEPLGREHTLAILESPELQHAHATGWSAAVRDWGTPPLPYALAAARVGDEPTPLGWVWLGQPLRTFTRTPGELLALLATVGAIAAVTTGVFVLGVVLVWRRALQRVIAAARHLSAGELADVPRMPQQSELAPLAMSLHELRGRLASQMELITHQRGLLAALINQVRDGVIVVDRDGRIVLINPAAVRLLDLPAGHGDAEHYTGQALEACVPQHALQRLLAGPADAGPDGGQRETQLTVQARPGTVHVLARASELVLPGASPDESAGRVMVLTDVTALQHALEIRTDFVANASHELRTPLATIRASVEALLTLNLASDAEMARDFLGKIDRHSLRLQQMVADLLDLSRLEAGTESFEPETLATARVLDELYSRFAEALARKDLRWAAHSGPDRETTLRANPHLLRLVLDNLVDNAIKFTDRGGEVAVEIETGPADTAIRVRDTGCGIPPEDQERVFERFYQVQRSRSGPERGTGLGLSIVRHATQALGGRVTLSSVVGQGTSVTITVPRSGAPAGRT